MPWDFKAEAEGLLGSRVRPRTCHSGSVEKRDATEPPYFDIRNTDEMEYGGECKGVKKGMEALTWFPVAPTMAMVLFADIVAAKC